MECLPNQRSLFALPSDAVWLNCAARSPLPLDVELAGHKAVSKKLEPWRITDDGIHERVREQFAELLGTHADNVALTSSTSYALSQVSHNLLRLRCVGPGEAVLVLMNQMSSNVYPWQHLCHQSGAHFISVPTPADGLWTEAVEAAVQRLRASGSRIALIAVPHYLWTDGSGPLDLEHLGRLCAEEKDRKTVFVVDATQSMGVVSIDVHRSGIDFLACSVHKWLFGPYGLSFLYAAEAWWQDERTEPLVQDEHNRLGADGDIVLPFDSIKGYAEDFARGARRFDVGGRPNPILLPMVSAALKQVMAWRPDRIQVSLKPLMARLVSGARALDLVTPRHHGPHLVGIGPGPQDVPQGGCHIEGLAEYAELLAAREKWADEASSYLKSRRIYVSSRCGSLRVAVHVYNSIEDVGIFLEAMRAFVQPRRAASASLL